MNETEIKIRRGTIADADALAPLAVKIFNDTFAENPLNKPEDMRAYINEFMSVEAFRADLADGLSIFFIAEENERMIGYAKLREHSPESCVADEDPIELSRLYVASELHGRGVAQALMSECFDAARRKNYRTMWLGVWEFNFRAQRFYEKLGFVKAGTHVFQLGADAQIDWVMTRHL